MNGKVKVNANGKAKVKVNVKMIGGSKGAVEVKGSAEVHVE